MTVLFYDLCLNNSFFSVSEKVNKQEERNHPNATSANY